MSWSLQSPNGDVTMLFSNLEATGVGFILSEGASWPNAAFWPLVAWLASSSACRSDDLMLSDISTVEYLNWRLIVSKCYRKEHLNRLSIPFFLMFSIVSVQWHFWQWNNEWAAGVLYEYVGKQFVCVESPYWLSVTTTTIAHKIWGFSKRLFWLFLSLASKLHHEESKQKREGPDGDGLEVYPCPAPYLCPSFAPAIALRAAWQTRQLVLLFQCPKNHTLWYNHSQLIDFTHSIMRSLFVEENHRRPRYGKTSLIRFTSEFRITIEMNAKLT